MKTLSKIVYLLLAIFLVPSIITSFAYGNTLDLVFMFLQIAYFVSLLYLTFFRKNKSKIWIFILGVVVTAEYFFFYIGDIILNNEGRDPYATIVFTAVAILSITVLIFIMLEIKMLKIFKQSE